MDVYERTMRERATYHQLKDVDWYVYDNDGHSRRFADYSSAAQYTLDVHGEPSCERGAECSDITPYLCHRGTDGRIAIVEGWLEFNDPDWYNALD